MNEELLKQTIIYLATRLAQVEKENAENKENSEYWFGHYTRLAKDYDKAQTPCQE